MTDISQAAGIDVARAPARRETRTYLFGPVIDFLCLGGGSFIVLGLICLFLPKGLPSAKTVVLTFVLVTLINNPHFAHSYQMFYRNFREKAFGSYPQSLRWRYVFAGIVVPIVLTVSMAAGAIAGVITRSPTYLAWILVPMFFLTGWHYVKQGYGILMVDSAQKKIKFSDRTKQIFRVNAYACWGLAWLEMNHSLPHVVHYDGIRYLTFALPAPFYIAALVICEITTVAAFGILYYRWRENRDLPWNGILAYAASLYLWLIFGGINPLMFLFVPVFHSLQYLPVVWRYQLNSSTQQAQSGNGIPLIRLIVRDLVWQRMAAFILIGLALGFLAFSTIPQLLDKFVPYDKTVFGPILFMFVFAAFINIHHYFIDNVIWRRGNPDVLKYVFMQRSN